MCRSYLLPLHHSSCCRRRQLQKNKINLQKGPCWKDFCILQKCRRSYLLYSHDSSCCKSQSDSCKRLQRCNCQSPAICRKSNFQCVPLLRASFYMTPLAAESDSCKRLLLCLLTHACSSYCRVRQLQQKMLKCKP